MDAVACDRPYSLNRCAVSRRRFIAICGLFIGTALARPGAAAPAVVRRANARSLRLYNTHTGERLRIVYWEPTGHQPGGYLEDALADINYLLRDHRTGAVHQIDPSLLDLLHELSAVLDTPAPFHVLSGFRSRATNARLVARVGAASHSFHMKGQAVDIRVPGRSLSALRRAAARLQGGGVGYYPYQGFVHIDVGPLRNWEGSRSRRKHRAATRYLAPRRVGA